MGSIPKTVGKYQVLGALGRGGMGEVFKAYQPDLHRHVAIKTLLSGEQATEEFLQRFHREARMVAKLSHPNIVPIYDIGAEGKLHFIVMEYVEGRTLKQLLAEKKLDPEKSLKIAYTVARALQFAHDHQIAHRDVKPANILIDRQGRVRILDFGLAKSLGDGKGLTMSSVMVGTPYYMSPEQAFGAPEEVDHRTDLYSLGAVLHEMLTGRPPFDGGTVLAILRKIEDEDVPPPGISPAVDALVLRALAKDRERRFQTAAEMADAIKSCLAHTTLDGAGLALDTARAVVAPSSPASKPAVFQIPRAAVWGAAAIAGAAALALAVWAAWPADPPPPSPKPPAARPAVAASTPPDLGVELRALLARKNEVTSAELAKFRDDSQLRRVIADHFLKRGHFTRALEDLRGYERALYELASARSLQRFVSPALFKLSIAQPPDLKGPEAFLMGALGRHLEGKQDAARQKLKAAINNSALSSHALLVRAHIDLCDVLQDPEGKTQKQILRDLRRELDRSEELFILPLRAIAAQLEGDGFTARRLADQLLQAAPSSAESFLLSAILFLRARRADLACDGVDDATRMDDKKYDSSILRVYLRWLEILNDPANEKLEVGPDDEKMDVAEMREALDERLRHDHFPAGLFLRAIHRALESRWDEAEEDLRKLERRTSLDRITVDSRFLSAFIHAGNARSRLLDAAAELQLRLGRREAAVASSELINGEELGEEERTLLLRRNHLRLAHLLADEEEKALWHLEESLKLGQPPVDLRNGVLRADLLQRPAFDALLKKYED